MTLIFALALLAADPQAAAAPVMEPEEITISDATAYTRDNSITRWTIDATGKGYYAGDRCMQCRAQQRYYEAFQLSPAIYQKVLDTLNPEILSKAKSRPCMLPEAQANGQETFEITIKKVRPFLIEKEHYAFFDKCQSAEIDAVKARMAAAKVILAEAVAKR
jgi:hypothetical protein